MPSIIYLHWKAQHYVKHIELLLGFVPSIWSLLHISCGMGYNEIQMLSTRRAKNLYHFIRIMHYLYNLSVELNYHLLCMSLGIRDSRRALNVSTYSTSVLIK